MRLGSNVLAVALVFLLFFFVASFGALTLLCVVFFALMMRDPEAYARLRRAWQNERSHPDILPYAGAEVEAVAEYVNASLSTDYAEVEKAQAAGAAAGGRGGDDEGPPVASFGPH